jgi:hypothetical protein
MDSQERYRREQDLLFQEMEEKSKLQEQAITGERLGTLLSKMKASGVEWSVISAMMDAGKKFADIIEFLNAEMFESLVRILVAYRAGTIKPISAEAARERLARAMDS